jgi:diguanylate cyclase (GGDEF)-like protein
MDINSAKPQILVVDDDPTNIIILADILEETYDLLVATDGATAIALAETHDLDLILLDVMMPGLTGYEVCRHLKTLEKTADIPVIFVTGLGEDDAEMQGLSAGAVDYLSKPINPSIVERRISNHIELKRARDRLSQLAMIDALTGLRNRRALDQALELECQRFRRARAGTLSVILIDIDHFKRFNDTYGHPAGDACLRQVGMVIRNTVQRASDVAARYGGEEFAAVLAETPYQGAITVAEQIRTGIERLALPHAGSPTAGIVTASLGVVTVDAGSEVSPGILIAAADTLLYGAKNQGRNRVVAAHFPNEFPPDLLEKLPELGAERR